MSELFSFMGDHPFVTIICVYFMCQSLVWIVQSICSVINKKSSSKEIKENQ